MFAYELDPATEPVNPPIATIDPLKTAVPILVKVPDPLTINEPDIIMLLVVDQTLLPDRSEKGNEDPEGPCGPIGPVGPMGPGVITSIMFI